MENSSVVLFLIVLKLKFFLDRYRYSLLNDRLLSNHSRQDELPTPKKGTYDLIPLAAPPLQWFKHLATGSPLRPAEAFWGPVTRIDDFGFRPLKKITYRNT